jgi:hypothetical protein
MIPSYETQVGEAQRWRLDRCIILKALGKFQVIRVIRFYRVFPSETPPYPSPINYQEFKVPG